MQSPPRDLEGQLAVIVGWGPTGKLLAEWLGAIALRIRVARNSREPAGGHATYTCERLREAAHEADWLVIACPLSDRTRALAVKDVFSAMRRGAHVVNVGRGEVVLENVARHNALAP